MIQGKLPIFILKNRNCRRLRLAKDKKKVSFSSMGKDMQTAKTALGNTPDVRESKIQDLKRRIDNGTYDVSVDDFAHKLLDSYSKTNI